MGPFVAIIKKQLIETRWFLTILACSLFAVSWLWVYLAVKIERALADPTDMRRQIGSRGFLAGMGGAAMDYSSPAIELAFWNHPLLILTFVLWPISRASAAPAGEIEKGSLDLVLSRPISRSTYLTAQIVTMVIGLMVLGAALDLGNLIGCRFNAVATPTSAVRLLRPTINLIALGLSIYGFTIVVSAVDIVRWRATLAGSMITLVGYVFHVIANIPAYENLKPLDHFSIFKAYNPVAAYVVGGEALSFNIAVLAMICIVASCGSYLTLSQRDLPCNS